MWGAGGGSREDARTALRAAVPTQRGSPKNAPDPPPLAQREGAYERRIAKPPLFHLQTGAFCVRFYQQAWAYPICPLSSMSPVCAAAL